MLLYYIGKIYDFDSTPSVGVVGTRNYSAIGEKVTKRVSYDLARSGFTIISGLARGIDSFSHKAALYNKSMTTAVLGCGIDVIYPPENRELTLRIHENGLVLTEFAPGTQPYAGNFPARNRIISALSDCIFVSECGPRSGTLITANHAFAIGTPVYMYGKLCAEVSEHLAIKGAKDISCADELTSDFIKRYPNLRLVSGMSNDVAPKSDDTSVTAQPLESFKQPNEKNVTPITSEKISELKLDVAETKIFERLKKDGAYADELVREGFEISDVLRVVSMLQFKGVVRCTASGKYVINT